MSRIYEASLRLQDKAALVLTIGLAFAGQRLFSSRPEDQFPVMAVVLICGAIATLVFLLARTRVGDEEGLPDPFPERTYPHFKATPLQIWGGLMAVGGSLLATILSQQPTRSWWALGLWIGAIICALLVVTQEERSRQSLRLWLRAHWAEAALVSACVLVAFLARSTNLATIPSIISGDEGSIGIEARDLLTGRNNQLFAFGWAGLPRMGFLMMALPMRIWGQDIYGLRMHAALVGSATILTLYWLIRPEAGRWLAQVSIWLFATYPYHIHFSRMGANQTEDSLFLTATFAAFFWGIRSKRPLGWALAGLFAALSLYTYPGARFVLILLAGMVGGLTLRTRARWLFDHWWGLAIAAVVFLLVGLPMIRYSLSHWNEFNTRLNQVGIVQSGWLERETELTGRSELTIIWRQFVRSFFAYGFYRDHSELYNDTQPLLLFWPAVLFPLGLATSLIYIRCRLFLLLALWFFGTVILAGTLTINPPAYSRLSGLSPALITLVALAVVTLARLGKRLGLWSRWWVVGGTMLIVAAMGIGGIRHYFVSYSPLERFGGRNAEVATEAGRLLRTVEPQTKAYFLGLPRMYYGFSTLTFLAPEIEGIDLPNPLTGVPPEYEPDRPSFYFSIPERAAELRQIADRVPGGQWIDVTRVVDGSPLFSAYYRVPGSASVPTPAAAGAPAYPAPAVVGAYPGPAITRAEPATSTHPATLIVILLPVAALLLFTGYGLWARGTRLWRPRLDVVVGAVFQDGVIKPYSPLHIPENTLLEVRIRTPATLQGVDANSPAGMARAPARNDAVIDEDRFDYAAVPSRGREAPWVRLALLVSGLALIAAAQNVFYGQLRFSWSGLIFALLAAWSLTLAAPAIVSRAVSSQPEHIRATGATLFPAEPWRGVCLLLAFGGVAWLLSALGTTPSAPSYNWGFPVWLGAIVLYLAAVSQVPRMDRSLLWQRRSWWKKNWGANALVVTILFVALGLRVWQLGSIPPTLGGDEGSQGLEAIKVLRGEIRNPFSTGWLGVPTMSFYFNAPTIQFMGNTMTALRLPWALVGTLTVLLTFWLVRRLTGGTLAFITAALLATYHYHIHFSRLGSNQVADAFFVALALLFLYRGYDRHSAIDWALCGVAVGVAQYFYAGARFTAIVVVAATCLLLLRDRAQFWREQRWGALIMIGAALLVAAPMIQYALRFPADYNARINEVGIIQNGWLVREQAIRNQGPIPILLDQLRRSALAFNAYPDRTVWYGSPRPLFDIAAGGLFLLGLGYSTLRLFDRRLFPMVTWWWGAVIMGGALTESPPSSQRLVTLAVPAVFFVALALVEIGRVLQYVWNTSERRHVVPYLAAAVLVLSLISVKWYFVDFTPMRVYGNVNAVVATRLGFYARDTLGSDSRIYFFGAPRMYVGFGSIPYLAPAVEGKDITDPLLGPLDPALITPDKQPIFVFLPERRNELAFVQQTFPDGVVEEMPSPLGGEPLFITYRLTQR